VFVNERAAEPMPAPAHIPPPDAVRSLDTRRGMASTSITQAPFASTTESLFASTTEAVFTSTTEGEEQ